ncbi:(ABC) transporter, partial [Perkinsus olseni]
MEEADALCETMVIQVDGQFRCIGSSQQIKTDYGQGFKLWISFTELSPASSAELLQNFSVLEDALKSDRYGRLTLTDEELQTSLGALDITEPRVVQSIVNTGTLNEADNTRIFTASALAAAVTGGTLHTRVLQWLHSVISPECESLGEIGEFSLPRTI